MRGLVERALANPWAALDAVLEGPLHPGGRENTAALLDRAEVGAGTRLLDVGCGDGASVALARERGARAVGLDRDPPEDGLRGELSALPVRDGAVDVVLAECVTCLVPDRSLPIREARRALVDGGRFALSEVVVEGDLPDLPPAIDRALCLSNATPRAALLDRIEAAGFAVESVRDHREELLATRDELAAAADYESLLGLLGERGERLLDGIEALEASAEAGDVGYVSVVARAE